MPVTSWWNAGPGVWHRYYGRYNLEARKVGKGYYMAVVTTHEDGKVYEAPAGTLAAAKRLAEQWVSNR
ncbi:MAG TPA: hypothetical protein VJW23_03580 [Propionibacteriaceae bacterium]|nr:hypothetical protein [Propionibacteriaceae bacterium]